MNTTRQGTSSLRYGIMVTAIATAAIHLFLAFRNPDPMFTTLFILNAVGYLALMIAYFLPQLAAYHGTIRWLLMAFTAVTVVAYFVFNGSNSFNPVGLVTKAIEVALIVLLWMDGRR